jgi:hypothetical protein
MGLPRQSEDSSVQHMAMFWCVSNDFGPDGNGEENVAVVDE